MIKLSFLVFLSALLLIAGLRLIPPPKAPISLPPDEVSDWGTEQNVLGTTSARTCPGISFLDILLDKSTSIPQDYTPPDLVSLASRQIPVSTHLQLRAEAANQLALLLEELNKYDLSFTVYSAFRSSKTQETVYQEWSKILGTSTGQQVAPPGHSEHQLGTAIDIVLPNGQSIYPSPTWNWLDNNAHRFGFIMSYRFTQQNETGYTFEPWHWRFVGISLASKIRSSAFTPESFYRRISCP